jgi:hypothetical protein
LLGDRGAQLMLPVFVFTGVGAVMFGAWFPRQVRRAALSSVCAQLPRQARARSRGWAIACAEARPVRLRQMHKTVIGLVLPIFAVAELAAGVRRAL